MDLRLKHVIHEIDTFIYFYDGELSVKEGVVTIPSGNDIWAGAAWINGYQLDAETGEQLSHGDVQGRVVAESDKKEDADEGANAGRQPAEEDGVRSSELPRDEGVLERIFRRGSGDGSTDGANGD